MNNEDTNINEPSQEGVDATPEEGTPTDRRPLGFWLRTVDGLITREFAAALDGVGATRRDWMLLNALSGDVELPPFAERFARKGKRLRGLADRGWVEESGDGTWVLTDEGRAAKEQLGAIVEGIRSRVAGAVTPDDFATTLASLEAIARELGWDENARMPRAGFGRGFRPGFGFDPGFRPGWGFGPGSGFGPRHFGGEHGHGEGYGAHGEGYAGHGEGYGSERAEGYGPHPCHPHHGHGAHQAHGSHHGAGHGEHRGHGRGERSGRSAQRAYERGFDAGFTRGRSAGSTGSTTDVA